MAKRGRPIERYDFGLLVWDALWRAKKANMLLTLSDLMGQTDLMKSQVRLGLEEARLDQQEANQQPIAVKRVGREYYYFLPSTVAEIGPYALSRARDAQTRIRTLFKLIDSSAKMTGDSRYIRIRRHLLVCVDDINEVVEDVKKAS